MKRVKFLLPMLAFLFAIIGAFATQHLSSIDEAFPELWYNVSACVECTPPEIGELDSEDIVVPDSRFVGTQAALDQNSDYYCSTEQSNNPRCYCIDDINGRVDATAVNELSVCVPLYKVYKVIP